LSIALTPCAAFAQPYPTHPIKLLVGGAAGSGPDKMVRHVAERLAAVLGQPVIVENRPGAGGIVAMDALVHSAPDGYTLAVATMSQAIFNSYLFAKLPYDPQRDLQPVALLVNSAFVIAAHPSLPAHSMPELIAIAKAQPGKLLVGMAQLGAPPHVVALLLNRAAGLISQRSPTNQLLTRWWRYWVEKYHC
jgi:tripartite-type tricarboxylate transporter receptor subunit TctC